MTILSIDRLNPEHKKSPDFSGLIFFQVNEF